MVLAALHLRMISQMSWVDNNILGFELNSYQFHGLSRFATTTSHVILGFALNPRQSHGLSGLALIISHGICTVLLIQYQFHGLSG